MGLLDFDLGDVGSILTSAREAITGKTIVDPQKLAELDFKLAQLEQASAMGQIQVNLEEAKSENMFKAGWRPFIGWTCGVGVAWTFVMQPMLSWFAVLFGVTTTFPTLHTGELMNLLLALLGFGAYRTYEKVKGVK